MNAQTFDAFGDELTKIAFFQKLRNGFVDALKEGWHGTEQNPQTWMGRGRQVKPVMQANGTRKQLGRLGRAWEEASSLGGMTRALPVGTKSMMLLGTGLMAREALRKEDPAGLQRSRAERVSGLAGNTIGGLVGSTLLARKMPGSAIASLAGGIGGSMIGEKLTAAPFAAFRRPPAQPPQYPQQPQQQVDPSIGAPV